MAAPHVLVVEDEQDLLEDLPLLFETYGFMAQATGNFDEAYELLRNGHFDCVLLDLKMPPGADMSDEEADNGRRTGMVVCRTIRRMCPDVPILVVTSVRDRNEHSLAVKAGASYVIQKPCYPDEIVNRMKALMKQG
jgi:DNA-binding response OmpR family regulator